MERDRYSQDFQPEQFKPKSNMGLRLAAAGALLASGIMASCGDVESSSPTAVPTPDKATTLTLDQMGSDAGIIPTVIVPKVFQCGIECLSPEDAARLGITWVDGVPVRKAPLPPACGCSGPHTHEEETPVPSPLQ